MSDKPSYWGKIFSITESPNTLRRKLQDIWRKLGPFYDQVQRNTVELALLEAYIKGLPAYGGVWRVQQPTTFTIPTTTAWTTITGYTELSPSVPKKVDTDIGAGSITVLESGVYHIDLSVSYQGQNGRFYEFGLSVDGADPTGYLRQEVLSNNGDMNLAFGRIISIMTVPAVVTLQVRSEIATTFDFDIGGFDVSRADYNNPLMVNQALM